MQTLYWIVEYSTKGNLLLFHTYSCTPTPQHPPSPNFHQLIHIQSQIMIIQGTLPDDKPFSWSLAPMRDCFLYGRRTLSFSPRFAHVKIKLIIIDSTRVEISPKLISQATSTDQTWVVHLREQRFEFSVEAPAHIGFSVLYTAWLPTI